MFYKISVFRKISASELLDPFQMKTVRNCKFGSAWSEVGSSAATSVQSEVVSMVQSVSLKQNMPLQQLHKLSQNLLKECKRNRKV